jgi:uncharacterized membrane protein YeaQ/YmgE (transglycosylase-associated protein family)
VSLLAFLILVAIQGLFVGALARLALPGRDPMTLPQTMGVGVAGSFIAGLVVALATDGAYGAGFLLSFTVTVLLVYFVRRSRGGDLTRPGTPGGR